MKKISKALLVLSMVLLWNACSDEPLGLKNDPNATNSKGGGPKSGSNSNDYLVSVSSEENGMWTYTIVRQNNGAKALSHFTINFGNCEDLSATIDDIVPGSALVNGNPATITNTEGNTGCNMDEVTNFVKFDNLGNPVSLGDGKFGYIIQFTLDVYYTSVLTTVWLKAGTSCHSQSNIAGPGCPETECSLSQGYWFAKPGITWELEIGDVIYNQDDGAYFWANRSGCVANKAFTQYAAIVLSEVYPAAIEDALNTIKAFLEANPLVDEQGDVKDCVLANDANLQQAQGAIGAWINANHCP